MVTTDEDELISKEGRNSTNYLKLLKLLYLKKDPRI